MANPPAEPTPIEPEAELIGDGDQSDTIRAADHYEDEASREQTSAVAGDEDLEGTAWAFEKKAELAEIEATVDKELAGTFPISDPPSNRAGPDIEPERP
jgi:hypothetical protein